MSRYRRLGRLSGAVSGQLTQALASFVLQVAAARLLGAAGLGTFALLYSAMIMAAAVSNGLVGDSLTVLHREQASVRAGIQNWCWITAIVVGAILGVVYCALGIVDGSDAILFAVATSLFLVESALRTLLMAVLRFWCLAVVDLVSLAAALGTLMVAAQVGSVGLSSLVAALAVGQACGIVAAIALLPESERHLAPWRPAAMREVVAFGGWRALQQSIRPTMLTVARLLITSVFGRAAYGQLEAARVYMSPALLVVQGLGGYLFVSYARARDVAMSTLVRRADRAATLMLVSTLVVGVPGTALVPLLGPIVTGPSFSLEPAAVFGWVVYAASSAILMPYASLVAVRGRQQVVVSLRVVESVATLGLLVVALNLPSAATWWAPYLLALGSFLDALVIRAIVIPGEMRRASRENDQSAVVRIGGGDQ